MTVLSFFSFFLFFVSEFIKIPSIFPLLLPIFISYLLLYYLPIHFGRHTHIFISWSTKSVGHIFTSHRKSYRSHTSHQPLLFPLTVSLGQDASNAGVTQFLHDTIYGLSQSARIGLLLSIYLPFWEHFSLHVWFNYGPWVWDFSHWNTEIIFFRKDVGCKLSESLHITEMSLLWDHT